MLTYEQALQQIVVHTPPPRVVGVPLAEALGLVLARPIIARCDLPRFDNSAVDGYALCAPGGVRPRELTEQRVRLRVVGTASAGTPYPRRLRPGDAVRIFTGAPIPRGTQRVIMQEHVEPRDGHLVIPRWPRAGQHIRRQGEDIVKGARVLNAGTRLRPQDIGLLAALGYQAVSIYQRPTVAILVTGDEVTPPGTPLKPGQIYESNGAMLGALVQQEGALAIRLGQVRDALHPLMAKIRKGLACDLLLISGGVSVGEKDFVRRAARQCGMTSIFWRVNIKPGMPLFLGKRGRTLAFGLPGNPVSVFVTFEEFVKPALVRLMGRPWRDGYTMPAQLAQGLRTSTTRRTHFIRVRCTSHDGERLVEPLHGQGSHQLLNLAHADGWIRMVADEGPWPAGTPVSVKLETSR